MRTGGAAVGAGNTVGTAGQNLEDAWPPADSTVTAAAARWSAAYLPEILAGAAPKTFRGAFDE